MKKVERINHELIFLNGKKQFNLSDLMETFHISKSTALRDIEELERLGVPLYAENGRYGGYKLIQSTLLPPIYFTENELSAIFFSLQLLKFTENSPFGNSYNQINKKLLKTFSEEKQARLAKIPDIVQYEGSLQLAEIKNLEDILESIIKGHTLKFHYTRYRSVEKDIFPIRLVIMDGLWYCVGLDLTKNKWRTYRCDFMKIIAADSTFEINLTSEQIAASYQKQHQLYRDIPFKARISTAGRDQFLKRHYANMTLLEQDGTLFITGKINKQEIQFLAQYFLSFGEAVEILEPELLKETYLRNIRNLLDKYQ